MHLLTGKASATLVFAAFRFVGGSISVLEPPVPREPRKGILARLFVAYRVLRMSEAVRRRLGGTGSASVERTSAMHLLTGKASATLVFAAFRFVGGCSSPGGSANEPGRPSASWTA